MKALFPRLLFGVSLAVCTLSASPQLVRADSQTVTVNESGFSPAIVYVNVGGGVTWTNTGSDTHAAASTGGVELPFDTGGVGPGQSKSIGFSMAGTYHYTSKTDCGPNVSKPKFNCATDYQVVVGGTPPPAAAATPTSPLAAPAPAPAPSAGAPAGNAPVTTAVVTLSDHGISPLTVNIVVGGGVTFHGTGNIAHTATTTGGGNPMAFDTGGLGNGQTKTIGFSQPGTYTYSSYSDCLNGNHTAGFDCGPGTIVVTAPTR